LSAFGGCVITVVGHHFKNNNLKRFDKILEGLKYKSPLPLLYEHGYTPETIKKEILSDFTPYFTNLDSLKKYAINYMVSDWINFLRISTVYPNIKDDIKLVVDSYNYSKLKNHTETIRVLAELMPLHLESGNKFWSFVNLEVPKSNLELDEFVQTSMKDISGIIEGISKVLYIEQVLIYKIIKGKSFDIFKVVENKLGNLIEELIANSNYPQLFMTEPDKIKLSDWRNIASHHTYSISKGIINCKYGERDKKKAISINREELFDRVHQCMKTTEVLSMAHKFFDFDNMDEIRKVVKPDDKEARDEMGFLILSSGIMSQGFEIVDIIYKDQGEAMMEVQDLTNGDPIKRGVHSSQFLVSLWVFTEKPNLIVRYKTQDGKLFMISKCDGETCELISSEQKEFSYLAEKVEFETINKSD
jgi:hypothetical protein